jgi:UDP-N-acetylmuramate--alanine ligase
MERSAIESRRGKVKAAHRYEVIDGSSNSMQLVGKTVHFIGIGGIGMSGLAQVLMRNRAVVSGSDQTAGPSVSRLQQLGVPIRIGHQPEHVPQDADAVVITAAVKPDNPELVQARQQGCEVYKYAQMLGQLMNRYQGIAVSGTHGKSTTSGWLSYLLRRSGIDASFIIGAVVSQLGSSSGVGDSPYFVAEACEYDRSFLNLRPTMAAVLNIEADHLDYYKDEAEIVEAFRQFMGGVAFEGTVVANGQDRNVLEVIKALRPDVECLTFGMEESCSYYAKDLELVDGLYRFDVFGQGQFLGRAGISLPGRHNVMNALAVVAMARRIGVPMKTILQGLPEFRGVDRRLTLRGRAGQVTVLDDYAHHPTEIRASLSGIRELYKPRRLWCVFQPHQYSRTRFLLEDFAESFKLADVTVVPEIYFVRDSQENRQAVNAQVLVDRLRGCGSQAEFIDGFDAICDYLQAHVEAGDVVVTMGAGDVWKVADAYIQRIRPDR